MSNANEGKPGDKKPEWKPTIETYSRMSKDGRFYIHRTVITDIKPVRYVAAVLQNKNARPDESKAQTKNRAKSEARR